LFSSSRSVSIPATVATRGNLFLSRPKLGIGASPEARSKRLEYDLETIARTDKVVLFFSKLCRNKLYKNKNNNNLLTK
jgi:hypothetical protein